MTGRPPIGASIDLGSNSVHLLIAEISGHHLQPLVDESVFLALGAAVDARAHLGREARDELTAALVQYVGKARSHGATHIVIMGTEPIRRAGDAAKVAADIAGATNVPLHVLSHEEEAYLTLIGVTSGWPVQHETLVVDIGGGSSEFCAVAAGGVPRAAGLRLGSSRLTNRFATSDPVSLDVIAAMRAAADDILLGALVAEPTDLVAVGGTASNLLKVTPGGAGDVLLTRRRIADALATLGAAPAAAVTERFAINPKRGPLLPAGAVIVDALMRRYGVEGVRVSEAGIREGAVLVADHAGQAWRDRLPRLASGWRPERRAIARARP